MNKNKFIKTALIVSMIFFGTATAFAVPPAPTPICNVEGIIKSVEFKDAYDEPCLTQPYGCQTDLELTHPARYFIDINIDSTSYVSGNTDFDTCENMYPIGGTRTIFIDADKVKPNDTFVAGQKIKGVVKSFWGSSWDSYRLGDETDSTTFIIILTLLVLMGIIYKVISSHKKSS
jgi:hypothetical protein